MGSANVLVPIALALFVPATYLSLRLLGPVRGVAAALLGGWLFLPVFDGRVAVPLLHSKLGFVPTIVLLVSVASDWARWSRFRRHWFDLVAAVVCVGPFFTALVNDLGFYEGASALLESLCDWGAPYLLGRLYFGSPKAAREYAIWLVGAALAYVPLCLWEIRMSPQLHRLVYGYRASGSFAMAVRYGGYRPDVFMAHGLAVGIFLACSSLVAFWLWRSRAVQRLLWLPMSWCFALLAAATVLVKSTGAIVLLAVGIAALEATRRLRGPMPILLLVLVAPAFCAARISGWDARAVVEAAQRFDASRASSLQYRIDNERLLLDKAMKRPVLGWGRWGRSRIRDGEGNDVAVTDSLWIIELGTGGLAGLGALGFLMLAPTTLLLGRFPARWWDHPALAPAAALAVASVLWVLDSLFNNMVAPIYTAMAGATITLLARGWSASRAPAPAARRPAERAPPRPPAGVARPPPGRPAPPGRRS